MRHPLFSPGKDVSRDNQITVTVEFLHWDGTRVIIIINVVLLVLIFRFIFLLCSPARLRNDRRNIKVTYIVSNKNCHQPSRYYWSWLHFLLCVSELPLETYALDKDKIKQYISQNTTNIFFVDIKFVQDINAFMVLNSVEIFLVMCHKMPHRNNFILLATPHTGMKSSDFAVPGILQLAVGISNHVIPLTKR